jgi:hypothetical protein
MFSVDTKSPSHEASLNVLVCDSTLAVILIFFIYHKCCFALLFIFQVKVFIKWIVMFIHNTKHCVDHRQSTPQ